MIKITQKAQDKIKELLPEKQVLRVSILAGGCSGMRYHLNFEEPLPGYINNNYYEYDFDGFKLVTDGKSNLFLNNVEIDYIEGLQGTGFVFNNSSAKRTCGCGESFSQ